MDEVRRLRSFLSHAADPGAWRVVIVDTADDLNPNAANALLKSLEEPPRQTVFLLLTSESGRLLPTIRSRCRRLDLGPLTPADLRRAATEAMRAEGAEAPSDEAWAALEELADGSVRRALSISGSGGLALYERAVKLVGVLPRVDWGAVHSLGDDLAGAAAEPKFEAFFDYLIAYLGRLIRARATGSGRPADVVRAEKLIRADALPAWAEAWSAIQTEKAEITLLNLDKKGLILSAIARLQAAAR